MYGKWARESDASVIRYAQCWEDADVLLEALDVKPEHTCLSIGSAGDNTLALLSRGPKRVIAVDFSPAQIACLELRVAAYRALSHRALLELVGSIPSHRRVALYQLCRPLLSAANRKFWDSRQDLIARGIGAAGRFESYLELFRSRFLPFIHSSERVQRLLEGGSAEERGVFYARQWNTWRWRRLCQIFFSRFVMARVGRDPKFFRYCVRSVSRHLLERLRYALTVLNPADNPYLQWISTGRHISALPYALRPENFDAIRSNLGRLEWHCASIEDFLDTTGNRAIDCYNLSDIFEYMPAEHYHRVLERLIRNSKQRARLAYWNMLVERARPAHLAEQLQPMTELSRRLYDRDKAFFYSAFVVEEVR